MAFSNPFQSCLKLSLSIKDRPPSFESEFNLHVNKIAFSNERKGTKTCFGKEAKDNSEMPI